MPTPQIIQDRYIDPDRLQGLLAEKFPKGTYSLMVSSALDDWYMKLSVRTDLIDSGNSIDGSSRLQRSCQMWVIPGNLLVLSKIWIPHRLTGYSVILMTLPSKDDPDLYQLGGDRERRVAGYSKLAVANSEKLRTWTTESSW